MYTKFSSSLARLRPSSFSHLSQFPLFADIAKADTGSPVPTLPPPLQLLSGGVQLQPVTLHVVAGPHTGPPSSLGSSLPLNCVPGYSQL